LNFDFNVEGIPKLNVGWRWEDQEAAVLSACSSLVIIVKHGNSRIVQFSHFSVKEFLTADRLAEPIRDVSRYHIRLDAAHTILARACLGVLLRLDDRVDRDNIKNFPLAQYAAQYWPTHARFKNTSSHIKDGMERLFNADKPHYAAWLWIHDGDYNFGRRVPSMSTTRPEKPRTVPLYYAAMLGFRDLAEHIIAEHPEHVNAESLDGAIPMYVAAEGGYADILSLLHQHGGDVHWKTCFGGFSSLGIALIRGKLEAAQFLLDCGAEINAQDNGYRSPLFLAVEGGHIEITRMLLKRGARTDFIDVLHCTPLHIAVSMSNIQGVRLLLEHGADVNVRDGAGETPSQIALQMREDEIAKLLSEYGAKSDVVSPLGLFTNSTMYLQYRRQALLEAVGCYMAI
jgi:ankyrin repeat protein